jgi:hypothetical protein
MERVREIKPYLFPYTILITITIPIESKIIKICVQDALRQLLRIKIPNI